MGYLIAYIYYTIKLATCQVNFECATPMTKGDAPFSSNFVVSLKLVTILDPQERLFLVNFSTDKNYTADANASTVIFAQQIDKGL